MLLTPLQEIKDRRFSKPIRHTTGMKPGKKDANCAVRPDIIIASTMTPTTGAETSIQQCDLITGVMVTSVAAIGEMDSIMAGNNLNKHTYTNDTD